MCQTHFAFARTATCESFICLFISICVILVIHYMWYSITISKAGQAGKKEGGYTGEINKIQ